METQKMTLIKNAQKRFQKILPCGGRSSFNECFTIDRGMIIFWFDTPDRSTHIEMCRIA